MNSQVVNLDRFKLAHEMGGGGGATYETALAELKSGQKTSHWIWYVFPQGPIGGYSNNALKYQIQNLEEAKAYVTDSLLFGRLVEVTTILRGQLQSYILEGLQGHQALQQIMGSEIDAIKTVSCLTLFSSVVGEDSSDAAVEFRVAAEEILEMIKSDMVSCQRTIALGWFG
jgi:uncharacterized protein (DUF1810 family)